MRFDNGEEKECASNILKGESALASLPPDMPVPARDSVRENRAFGEAEGDPDLPDAEEAEDLPMLRPEEEDAEVVEEERKETEATDMDEEEAINNNEASNAPDEAVHDPNGRMPGQLPTAAAASVKDYHSIKKAAKKKVAALVGTEVMCTSKKNGTMKWTVVESHAPPDEKLISKGNRFYGLKGFSVADYRKSEVLVHLFLELTFLDWKGKVDKMNLEIQASNSKCRKFSYEEFLIGMGLMIVAAEFSQKGVELFGGKKGEDEEDDIEQWPSISPAPHFEQYMAFSRFKDFRNFCPQFMQIKVEKKVILGGSFQV